ncbi:MAG TPA: KpsF/GutQ family sugar-phosphate isomerase [Armatimonadetes bacterium]|nr:KpsF/GutQ family sugar-phosphate isomerase [Armatimonadota bacterium]
MGGAFERALEVLRAEAEAVSRLAERLDREEFERAVSLILNCKGRVVVTGIGKSGAIGRKIAATFASTGTPSLFLHPAEGVHGDLGMVTEEDVVLALSHSGETEEVLGILPVLKRIGARIIALTGRANSTLAKQADIVLLVEVDREACPLNLTPTSSTTAMLALGDALAIAVMSQKRFTKEDFAKFHPGGTLGRRLLLRVRDIMRTGDRMAVIGEEMAVREALFAITKAQAGATHVVDRRGRLVGIVTDGDLRRAIMRDEKVLSRPVREIMTKNPITIGPDRLAAEALRLMRERQIDDLPVVDEEGRPVGMLDVQDLLSAGLV